jgi:hypothetical protein
MGEIAMVDFRPMPRPGKPEEVSDSRMIVRIGKDYWAVELGQRLNERRVLRPAELPEELKNGPPALLKEGPAQELKEPSAQAPRPRPPEVSSTPPQPVVIQPASPAPPPSSSYSSSRSRYYRDWRSSSGSSSGRN